MSKCLSNTFCVTVYFRFDFDIPKRPAFIKYSTYWVFQALCILALVYFCIFDLTHGNIIFDILEMLGLLYLCICTLVYMYVYFGCGTWKCRIRYPWTPCTIAHRGIKWIVGVISFQKIYDTYNHTWCQTNIAFGAWWQSNEQIKNNVNLEQISFGLI